MNNSNPLIPQGSLLEQQNKGRARVKVAVLCVLGLHVLFFGGLLMLGCKKEQAAPPVDGTAANDPSLMPPDGTNTPTPPLPVPGPGNTAGAPAPALAPAPAPVTDPVPAPVPAPATADYVVLKGDSYYTIAKKLGVPTKALENANPTILPTKLKPGQKLVVPAGAAPVVNNAATPGATAMMAAPADGGSVYTVKSGDSLTKVAKDHGVSVKSLRAANDLKTDKIKVGQKLKLPAKASAPAPEPAPVSAPVSAPVPPPSAYAPPVSAPVATGR
ncbi:MAG: muramidase-2 [Pedosphaera sp.]|nr:muramidase-2 [Pedosphaera sp.]